ncbi:MAG: hypothetical protein RIT07_1728 [Bacteroidota bacterium]
MEAQEKLVLFEEKQRFTQKWIWLLLLTPFLFPMVGLIFPNISNDLFMFNASALLVNMGVYLSILLLFCFGFELNTEICTDGIYVRFRPFHRKPRFYAWSAIEHCEIRKYKPLFEYGGWGVRRGLMGTAFNVRGNMGLQLVIKGGKRVLIGTQKATELAGVLKSIHIPDA